MNSNIKDQLKALQDNADILSGVVYGYCLMSESKAKGKALKAVLAGIDALLDELKDQVNTLAGGDK